MVTLDFDSVVLKGASCAEPRLELVEESFELLTGQVKPLDHGHGLAAAPFPLEPDTNLLPVGRDGRCRPLWSGLILPRYGALGGIDESGFVLGHTF